MRTKFFFNFCILCWKIKAMWTSIYIPGWIT